MSNEKRPNPGSTFPQRGKKYSALFDLQDFLEKEIEDASPGAFYRSFVPLTDGLGLESPQKSSPTPTQENFDETPPLRQSVHGLNINALFDEPIFMAEAETVPKVSDIISAEPLKKVPAKPIPTSGVSVTRILESLAPRMLGSESDLKAIIAPEDLRPVVDEAGRVPDKVKDTPRTSTPPPLPTLSASRRLMAAMIDQVFVLTLWASAIVITSNMLNNFQSGFSIEILKDFSNPTFQRFAILEFSALWLTYFAVSLGIMDLTFGMWVWGLRVSYGDINDPQYWMRRIMRVIWSFLFFAPVVPAFFLMVRRKGRNLLDVLSGTNLYVAG